VAEKEDDHQKFTAHHDNDGSHTLCARRARAREIKSRERAGGRSDEARSQNQRERRESCVP
jgi:hypothetical protein